MIRRNPIFCPAVYTSAVETITINRKGAHQAALRRRSVNVLDGAINVLMILAPCERGSACGVGVGDVGVAGAETMIASCERFRGILFGDRTTVQAAHA